MHLRMQQQQQHQARIQVDSSRQQAHMTPATVKWFYRDPQGNVQGPFGAADMRQWLQGGFFSPALPVSYSGPQGNFVPLHTLFASLEEAFISFPRRGTGPSDQYKAQMQQQQQQQQQPQQQQRATCVLGDTSARNLLFHYSPLSAAPSLGLGAREGKDAQQPQQQQQRARCVFEEPRALESGSNKLPGANASSCSGVGDASVKILMFHHRPLPVAPSPGLGPEKGKTSRGHARSKTNFSGGRRPALASPGMRDVPALVVWMKSSAPPLAAVLPPRAPKRRKARLIEINDVVTYINIRRRGRGPALTILPGLRRERPRGSLALARTWVGGGTGVGGLRVGGGRREGHTKCAPLVEKECHKTLRM